MIFFFLEFLTYSYFHDSWNKIGIFGIEDWNLKILFDKLTSKNLKKNIYVIIYISIWALVITYSNLRKFYITKKFTKMYLSSTTYSVHSPIFTLILNFFELKAVLVKKSYFRRSLVGRYVKHKLFCINLEILYIFLFVACGIFFKILFQAIFLAFLWYKVLPLFCYSILIVYVNILHYTHFLINHRSYWKIWKSVSEFFFKRKTVIFWDK